MNGQSLPNAWAGGLNAAQFTKMHLNDDGREDLVVFDRTSNKISTFLSDGLSWQYAPDYEAQFPSVQNWMILVDYDGDGRKDLFTHVPQGVKVLKNVSTSERVSWQVVADPLLHEGLSSSKLNLYVASTDVPAIVDFDDDGDIDIIAFDITGNYAVYFQNLSKDRQNAASTTPGLDFKRTGQCWGNFIKEHCNDFTFGVDCSVSGGRLAATAKANPRAKVLHAGNTITVMDTDGDGKKDLLFGHVSCTNVARLRNAGTNNEKANFVSFDAKFPAQDAIEFKIFPATYFEDMDGDGIKDLVASPNTYNNEGTLMDFRASNWFFKNVGTTEKPDFQLVQKNFLQSDMIDLGENAAPTLADLDGDGDMDLLVGNGGIRGDKGYRGSIWYFENKGTSGSPVFELITSDYLRLSETLQLTDIVPALADVDGNGSLDLVITATTFKGAEIRVLYNKAPRGAAAQYTLADAKLLPVPDRFSPGDLPVFYDVDKDGKPDMLLGKASGNIEYHRNTGTPTTPAFQVQTTEFGGIKLNLLARSPSLVIADFNADQKPELLTTTRDGKVQLYRWPDSPTQALTPLEGVGGIPMPGGGLISTAADLDGDQLPDVVMGTMTGGLRYIKNTTEKAVITGIIPVFGISEEDIIHPWAYPNPTERYINIRPPFGGVAEVLSAGGQRILPGQSVQAEAQTTFDLGSLPDGIYFIRLTGDGHPARLQKVVLWK
ncbi:hypothetical protein GCM10023189_38540 [Nibrella saemangeumensis]|uniref:Secretion system C-terminal sorting domain-containing protein n=2 Tax=Nibrella saemangeumensis TaxID=1084526 RepID=A0ABP8N6H6_9BACT